MAIGPLLLWLVFGIATIVLLRRGSPYADSKVLMLGGPAMLLMAMLGSWSLVTAGRGFEGFLIALIVGGGVLASNAITYHNAQPAPYHRYQELLDIGDGLKGHGPAVLNEYDEFGKYFRRDALPYRPARVPARLLRPRARGGRRERAGPTGPT